MNVAPVEELRLRVGRLWAELAELTDEPPATLRDAEDDQLAAMCTRLERQIREARR